MTKIVNFRSFFYSAIMLMATAYSLLLALKNALFGAVLVLLIIVVPLSSAFILRRRIVTYKCVTFVMTSLLCFAATMSFFITVYTWVPTEIQSGYYSVNGIIEDNYVVDGQRRVILKNLTLNDTKVNGKMKIILDDEEKFFHLIPCGETLSFDSYVNVLSLVGKGDIYANNLRSNIRFSTNVNADRLSISDGKVDILMRIKLFVRNTLTDKMGNEYGVIAYGLLSGDKSGISEDVRNAFSGAGIAHILAVSGLHIGFLTTILYFVLKRLRIGRVASFIVVVIVLFLYAVFAGFSPSVVRAVIMCMIGSGAAILGEQKDMLNSLGCAMTVILTVCPIMAFDVGFLMSVGAVYGLILFISPVTEILSKLKLNAKISDVLSVPIAAQIGIMPVMIYYFSSVQTYSILVNVVLMPLMQLAFISVFVSVVVSIIPFMSFTVALSGYLIKGIFFAAAYVSALPFAEIAATASPLILLLYPLYFIGSRFVNLPKKNMVSLVCTLACIGLISVSILL